MNQSTSRPVTSGMALASMILGIIGIFFGWMTFAVVPVLAVVFGHKAFRKVRRSNGALSGDGMAIAGLITGYIGLFFSLLFLLGMITAITIPAYHDYTIRARVAESATAVVQHKAAITAQFNKGLAPGELSTEPDDLGLKRPEQYQTRLIKSIDYDAQGVVTVTFRHNTSLGTASGRTVVFSPSIIDGRVVWSIDRANSTVPHRFLPKTP